jgi:hypothetical protein
LPKHRQQLGTKVAGEFRDRSTFLGDCQNTVSSSVSGS